MDSAVDVGRTGTLQNVFAGTRSAVSIARVRETRGILSWPAHRSSLWSAEWRDDGPLDRASVHQY